MQGCGERQTRRVPTILPPGDCRLAAACVVKLDGRSHIWIEPTSPGPHVPLVLTNRGPHVILTLTSPGPHVPLMLTSPGPHVTLILTSPGPHVILPWQAT